MKSRLQLWQQLAPLGAALAFCGCATLAERVSPDEDENTPQAPESFLQADGSPASPTSPSPDGWWNIYNDPLLDQLIERMQTNNFDLKAAVARMDQSFALLGITRGPLLPRVDADLSASRRRDSVSSLNFPIDNRDYDRYRIGASASWELDLWGRVRATVKRDRLRFEAQQELLQDTLLSLQASLARQYFACRTAAMELQILRNSIRVRRENLDLREALLELGNGIEIDVARARVELHNAQAAEEVATRRLGKQKHALALLVGIAPSQLDLVLPSDTATTTPGPQVPAGVPSTLLERRPDLRAADRTLQAAAIQIGVRKTEPLPRITLNGEGGVASLRTSNLIDGRSIFFDIGPRIDVPVFQSRVASSAVRQAEAQWREAAADYGAALLTAVREVDDALLDLKSIAREASARRQAVDAAGAVAASAKERHEAGLASYFEFIDAERTRLQAQLEENALRGEQWSASVSLIQALGGAW